jgi:hypothetical protein
VDWIDEIRWVGDDEVDGLWNVCENVAVPTFRAFYIVECAVDRAQAQGNIVDVGENDPTRVIELVREEYTACACSTANVDDGSDARQLRRVTG